MALTMSATEAIDTAALRTHLGPRGPWASDAAARIQTLLDTLDPAIKAAGVARQSQWLAREVDVTETTIVSILRGELVPRDYLRAAIAWRLGKDVADIWPPLRRDRISDFVEAAVA